MPSRPFRPRRLEEMDLSKEASRSYRRTVFTFDDWAAHRSASRYSRHLSGLLT